MIDIEEAFAILRSVTVEPKKVRVPVNQALDFVLSEAVHAHIAMPPFRQSNMDGYALSLHDGLKYRIVGEIKAGDFYDVPLQSGEAVKIFTGARLPDSANAVIPVEKINEVGSDLFLQEPCLTGANIRPMGSQIQKGDLALNACQHLNAAGIGFLSSLGITEVHVFAKPRVAIVITGNELTPPGETLSAGKVYESNSSMLSAALQANHFPDFQIYQAKDDLASTVDVLQQAISENDLIMVSGGISVGDYDFVGKAMTQLQVEPLFYKVNQKPGKPLFSGLSHGKVIFALPGNPAASLTCFYVYVLPTLLRLSVKSADYGKTILKKLSHDLEVGNSRSQFLKAVVKEDEVAILSYQDSSMLNTFALANALVWVDSGRYVLPKGTKVRVYCL